MDLWQQRAHCNYKTCVPCNQFCQWDVNLVEMFNKHGDVSGALQCSQISHLCKNTSASLVKHRSRKLFFLRHCLLYFIPCLWLIWRWRIIVYQIQGREMIELPHTNFTFPFLSFNSLGLMVHFDYADHHSHQSDVTEKFSLSNDMLLFFSMTLKRYRDTTDRTYHARFPRRAFASSKPNLKA